MAYGWLIELDDGAAGFLEQQTELGGTTLYYLVLTVLTN